MQPTVSLASYTPEFTATALQNTPTPIWIHQGPDTVCIPILLYHHIGMSSVGNQYMISPEMFSDQMRLLHDLGYQTITTTDLLRSIEDGADLPSQPILITFDDGNLDNYTYAYPIMWSYGFVGVEYLVGNYIDAEQYMTTQQIVELIEAGWEMGSHGMSHVNLVNAPPQERFYEIHKSRIFLEQKFGTSFTSFAYPYGEFDTGVMNAVYDAGYKTGMGLGYGSIQRHRDQYALHRIAIKGTYDLEFFESLLKRDNLPQPN